MILHFDFLHASSTFKTLSQSFNYVNRKRNFNAKLLEVIKQQENQLSQFHPMDFLPFQLLSMKHVFFKLHVTTLTLGSQPK
jgi:hypothetical protein